MKTDRTILDVQAISKAEKTTLAQIRDTMGHAGTEDKFGSLAPEHIRRMETIITDTARELTNHLDQPGYDQAAYLARQLKRHANDSSNIHRQAEALLAINGLIKNLGLAEEVQAHASQESSVATIR